MTKFVMIFVGIIVFYFTAWKTEKALPKTSRSLYYIGGFLYGSGIFLIGQTFHLGGEIYTGFLLWAIGILPLGCFIKDKAIIVFSILLLFLYSTEIYIQGQYPYLLLLTIPFVYVINHKLLSKSSAIFLLNSALLVHFIHSQLWFFNVNQLFIILLLFVSGLVMSLAGTGAYIRSFKVFGHLLHGVYGISLTFAGVWNLVFLHDTAEVIAITFAILYGLFIIWLVRQGNIISILLLCSLIFRFYIDFSYDFLPKSLFFIVGGIILLLFGFWFERSRRGEGHNHEIKPF